MRAGDVRQFVYCLVPRSGVLNPSDNASFDLGRLEMAWRTTLGEPGRLHSLVCVPELKHIALSKLNYSRRAWETAFACQHAAMESAGAPGRRGDPRTRA